MDWRHQRERERRLGEVTCSTDLLAASSDSCWSFLRWSAKQPLHVSAASPPSPSSTNAPSSSPSHPSSHSRSVSTPFAPSSLPPARTRSEISASLADSQIDEQVTTTGSLHGSSFTTALAMLVYDVCYLAYSQAVEVPLAQAGELLGNLWAVCCSPELGR